MATGSQATADVPSGRSGGKILKARRTAARKTPYDRPTPPQPEPSLLQSESPSWLGGLVSPAKFVAGGATKIFSSFWNPKSWATASDSSSDSDSESEDDSEDEENPAADVTELNQEQNTSSSQKTEILHLVEQLLMLERFSREECDKLIEIINSRVVDYAGPSMIHSMTNNETETQAVMEARKWVADNKARSAKKSDLDNNGLYALKYIMTPQAPEEEGSPVEVAKSYMKTRPPWASPLRRDNTPSPSPLTELLKERSPYSSDGGISFTSPKGGYLSAGSWNIHDEIRKVRSKATEDLLNSHRSMKLLEHSVDNYILETSKPVDEIMEPTVEEKEKERRGHGEGNGMVNEDCVLMTESGDIPGVNNSQDSLNDEQNLGGKEDEKSVVVTRGSRTSSRRGRGRGK